MIGRIILLILISTLLSATGSLITDETEPKDDTKEKLNLLDQRLERIEEMDRPLLKFMNILDEKMERMEKMIRPLQDIMPYLRGMKNMMKKDLVRFPNPLYGNGDNGTYFIQGHVEIIHDNVWGTICDDDLDASDSNAVNVATVLCRMQGYDRGDYKTEYKQPSATKSTQVWITRVRCGGDERNIEHCALPAGWGEKFRCKHNEDVGIRCFY